jgi:hypothetical protein
MTTDTDDKRVTSTYRDLPDERAPAALNQQVLAMAAREARTRYGWTRAWIRPVAWAATIALSLAFFLEISRLDEAPVPTEPSAPPAKEALERDAAASDAFAAEDLKLLQEAEEQARMRGGEARAADAAADAAAEAPKAEEPRAAASKAAIVQKVAASARQELATARCEDEVRGAADSWYACVLELRRQGHADAAARELEALLKAFPDFREPGPQ